METPQIDAIAYYSKIRNEYKKKLAEFNKLNWMCSCVTNDMKFSTNFDFYTIILSKCFPIYIQTVVSLVKSASVC